MTFLNFEAWFGLRGFRIKHVEDGEPFSRRVFEFGRVLRWMVVVGVLPLDSYTHEYKGDKVSASQILK